MSTGMNYEKLPNVVTIFILPYDPFGKNRMVYTFRNQCVEDADVTNGELGDVHRLVDRVKSRKEVDLSYMKSWEWDAYNRKLGREEGREEGIRALITSCRNLNGSRGDILKQLIANLSLDEATASEYLDKYYQE